VARKKETMDLQKAVGSKKNGVKTDGCKPIGGPVGNTKPIRVAGSPTEVGYT
jgi:hypothetical protein